MRPGEGGTFGPETIEVMRRVLEEAWDSLPPEAQTRTSKTLLRSAFSNWRQAASATPFDCALMP